MGNFGYYQDSTYFELFLSLHIEKKNPKQQKTCLKGFTFEVVISKVHYQNDIILLIKFLEELWGAQSELTVGIS